MIDNQNIEIKLTQETFSDLLKRDEELRSEFLKAIKRALEREKVVFHVNLHASDFFIALKWSIWDEMKQAIEKAVEKQLEIAIRKAMLKQQQ